MVEVYDMVAVTKYIVGRNEVMDLVPQLILEGYQRLKLDLRPDGLVQVKAWNKKGEKKQG
ncbi:MAG: hypothetical protein QXI87_08055 [Thermoproteota archaeon]